MYIFYIHKTLSSVQVFQKALATEERVFQAI